MTLHNLTEGEWVTLSEEELAELERPDYSALEDYERTPLWSEILPGLWQGGTHSDEEIYYLRRGGEAVTCVTSQYFDTAITLYASAMPADWHVKELRLGIYDSDMADFDPQELFELVKTAHTDWKAGKRVLIRCQAGWNRSGLVMALVLIREGYGAQEAIDLIREKRCASALCNRHFVSYLLKQDKKVWQGAQYGIASKKSKKN